MALLLAFSMVSAAAAAFQTRALPSSSTEAPATGNKPIVLVGCVVADKANTDWFTLSDPKSGNSYRLTGTNVALYSGRRVRIIGGLFPTPNIASQAGVIDPTKAAMAIVDADRNRAGSGEPIEFRISRLRPLNGPCPPR